MKSFIYLLTIIPTLIWGGSCNGQIKNAKTLTVTIDGNCEMCEHTIESAANQKKTVNLNWNQNSKQATLTYDSTKTSTDDILKRVALAGYDNEKFLAPDEAYAGLSGCCQYQRNRKKPILHDAVPEKVSEKTVAFEQSNTSSGLKKCLEVYFDIKNALVKSDYTTAGIKAAALSDALSKVEESQLGSKEREVWVKINKDLIAEAGVISKSTGIEEQRNHFMSLSNTMYELAKVAHMEMPIYYQHCPMYNDGKGANWLSTENAVKNPYYGSQMLSCGKTVETIK